MQGLKYLVLGLFSVSVSLLFLFNFPNALQSTVSLIIGALVLGFTFFGLVFLFVALEEIKSGIVTKEVQKETKKKK